MAATPYDGDDAWEEPGELDLADDERLPWLEAADEEDDTSGFDGARIAILAVLAFAVLAAVVGGIWYFGRAASDEPPADGSVIAAPTEPYKTKPENEGGKVFPGTGDTSFAVAEGKTLEGRLADPAPASSVAPSVNSTVEEGERVMPAASGEPALRGKLVQVGAYPQRADAEAAWANLMRQTEALNGVRHRVVEAQVDIGRVYRLQAVMNDRASANRLCDTLKADGLACFVK